MRQLKLTFCPYSERKHMYYGAFNLNLNSFNIQTFLLEISIQYSELVICIFMHDKHIRNT